MRLSSSLVSLGTISILFLAACSPKNAATNPSNAQVNPSAIVDDKFSSNGDKAEALSILAARLLTPTTFMHAFDVSGQALTLDSTNRRALLIHATLAPQMALKGLLSRIQPLANQSPAAKQHVDEARAKVRQFNNADIEKFALDGPADIWSVRDGQELVAQYTAELDHLRTTLSGLRDQPFSLKLNLGSLQRSSDGKICEIKKAGDTYDFSGCDESKTVERSINNIDLELFKQDVAGLQVFLATANAYDVTGVFNLAGKKMSSRDAYKAILQDPSTGILRQTNGLGVIPALAKDAVVGARMAMKLQNEYCPKGHSTSQNRPGALFENGLCIQRSANQLEAFLKLADTALAGGTILIPVKGSPGLQASPLRLFTTPVQNVRDEAAQFNSCDQLVSFGDGSLQGAFPDRNFNLNQLLAQQKRCQQ